MSNLAPLFVSFHVYYCSVPDPDPDVFGRPVSGSVSMRCGSESFHKSIKTKTLLLIVLRLLYDFLLLNIDVNVALKSTGKKQKN
jgi:hypothetical protein